MDTIAGRGCRNDRSVLIPCKSSGAENQSLAPICFVCLFFHKKVHPPPRNKTKVASSTYLIAMSKTKNKEKLLSVMFVLLNQGVEEPSKARVQKMAQISKGTYPSLLSRIVGKDGTLAYGSDTGTLKLTAKGRDVASRLTPPEDLVTTNAAVHENIKKNLKGKALQIFEFLSDGEEYEKEAVKEAINCLKDSTFKPLLSRELKSKDIVVYPSKTTVQLNRTMCFPFDE